MRVEFRTLTRAISTLVVLCVLFLSMGLDASAQRRGRNWDRNHSHGRHLGWTRGRRVGQQRRVNSNWRRQARRHRRFERRSSWNNDRNWQGARYMQTVAGAVANR